MLDESRLKPNKIWLDKWREIYNILVKSMLQDIDMATHSTRKEGKSLLPQDLLEPL